MNNVVLIGRLARDPELSYTPNAQTAVTRFTLAVDRPRKQGEDQGADFIRITVFGRQAETADRYLKKGRQAAVQGRIQTGSYKNHDGVTVYTTDVIADRVEFLGGGGSQDASGPSAYGDAPQSAPAPSNASEAAPEEAPANVPPQQMQMGDIQGDLPDSFQAAEDDIPF